VLGSAVIGTAAKGAGRTPRPSHCAPTERVLYSCAFPRGVGSLCASQSAVHYRYGPLGKPGIDIGNKPDWSNVHLGTVRGQGDGRQSHVRFSRGTYHYVVFEGMNGSLTESPGHAYSGIAVLEGAQGERELATLSCRGQATISLDDALLNEKAASEQTDGPFDMWY
jgi:hypothetical protein